MKVIEKAKKQPYFLATLILVISIGVVLGHGLYTFVYAKGFSYMSDDPSACKNCHVMNQVFESWERGGHQHVATCNDCHVPHDFIGKWMMKAESGFGHSYAFTAKDNPVPFSANAKSKKVIQNNCIECHGEYAATSVNAKAHGGDPNIQNESLSCVSCHRQVGHAHNY
ncbi:MULTISPECIES: cytochrome c nitrite reductase small subunit [unclassified Campylobacter]|uniref:cytochrome c nitrite reductase small subunit n=1 Tax=Campylobacter sp. RM16192 TaxID=1660080 RepID=UPI0014514A97|nr:MULTISPECIES: cytochrome c nitrite reductase small subunit [unclassified Campylobacter]QCD52076.1 formate-dependent nitrite reductase NrfAH, membrane-bound tetraheme cytochrome c subunit [Campylobacter sp. RM16192]